MIYSLVTLGSFSNSKARKISRNFRLTVTSRSSYIIIGITNNPSLYDPFRNAKFEQNDGSYKTCRQFNKERQ